MNVLSLGQEWPMCQFAVQWSTVLYRS